MKSRVLHTVRCYISGEAAGQIWNWPLLRVKGWLSVSPNSALNVIDWWPSSVSWPLGLFIGRQQPILNEDLPPTPPAIQTHPPHDVQLSSEPLDWRVHGQDLQPGVVVHRDVRSDPIRKLWEWKRVPGQHDIASNNRPGTIYRGHYNVARRYAFYFRVVKTILYEWVKLFSLWV